MVQIIPSFSRPVSTAASQAGTHPVPERAGGRADPAAVDTFEDSADPHYRQCRPERTSRTARCVARSLSSAGQRDRYAIQIPARHVHAQPNGSEDRQHGGRPGHRCPNDVNRRRAGADYPLRWEDRPCHRVRPGSEVLIRDLTIQNGQAPLEQGGGGLLNRGVLELVNVTVTQNRAGNNDIGDPWELLLAIAGQAGAFST